MLQMWLPLLSSIHTKYQLPISLQFQRYSPDKMLKLKVTMARAKVKSRSHHDIAHLHSPNNVHTMYKDPTPHSFWEIAQTSLFPPTWQPTHPTIWMPWVKTIPTPLKTVGLINHSPDPALHVCLLTTQIHTGQKWC